MGTVRADNFSDAAGTGAPDFATGIKASGGFDTSGGAGLATIANSGLVKLPQRSRWSMSTTGYTANQIIDFGTVYLSWANVGTWSNTSGSITIPTTGTYRITLGLQVSGWPANASVVVVINGSGRAGFVTSGDVNNNWNGGTVTLDLTSGDVLTTISDKSTTWVAGINTYLEIIGIL